VVENLGRGVERSDRRQPATDATEVNGGDDEARHRAGENRVTVGEHGGQHDPPGQRDGDVGGASRDHGPAADRACRLEQVAPSGDGQRRRRRATEDGTGGAGDQPVGYAPIRWVASLRRRL
jgi:hypothetical protein